jgi:uncharacterized protein
VNAIDRRRILIYLAFVFGIAWAMALVVYLTGGLAESPMIIPALNISLALVLLALGVMWAPAVAHILTRVVTREGWADVGLRPNLRRGWPYWLAAWFLPGILTVIGMVAFFVLFPATFDPTLSTLMGMLPPGFEIDPWILAAAQLFQAMLIAPLVNSFFTFGEEFGWRGYLQPKFTPLGGRRATLLVGIIWGIWHAPIIAMGHNYGLTYPGAPWAGVLMMVWITVLFAALLGWVTVRGGSVWPAVIGHAAINGIAGLGAIFVRGQPNPLLGPLPVGIIGSAGFALLALIIYLNPRALAPREG